MKYLVTVITVILCTIVALLPEAGMYFIWHTMNPVTEMGRIASIALLLFFGGGASIAMAIIAFAVAVAFINSAWKVYR